MFFFIYFLLLHHLISWPQEHTQEHTRCPTVHMTYASENRWGKQLVKCHTQALMRAVLPWEDDHGRTEHERARGDFRVKEEQYVVVWTYFGFRQEDAWESLVLCRTCLVTVATSVDHWHKVLVSKIQNSTAKLPMQCNPCLHITCLRQAIVSMLWSLCDLSQYCYWLEITEINVHIWPLVC